LKFLKKYRSFIILIIFFCSTCNIVVGQEEDDYNTSSGSNEASLSEADCQKFLLRLSKKINRSAEKIRKSNDAYLDKYNKATEQVLQKLCLENEAAAEALINNSWYSENRFRNKCSRECDQECSGNYLAMDTIDMAVNLLKEKTSVKDCGCIGFEEFKTSRANLRKEIKRTELISGYLAEQTGYFKDVLGERQDLLIGLKQLEKAQFYHSAQFGEIMNLFGDFNGIEGKVLDILGVKGMMENMAGQLEPNHSNVPNLDISKLLGDSPAAILDVFASETAEIKDAVDQPIQEAKDLKSSIHDGEIVTDSISNIKGKVKSEGYGDKSDLSWKPNPLKTKRFIDRVSYGSTLNIDRKNNFFPTTGTLAFQAGYQISPKSNFGIGASSIFGSRYSNIKEYSNSRIGNIFYLSGLGYRGYMDYELLKDMYFEICFERNFYDIEINDISSQSGLANNGAYTSLLAGLKIKKGSSKKTSRATVEILCDLLSPQTGRPMIVVKTGIEIRSKHSYTK
jgi:hypothetical protein